MILSIDQINELKILIDRCLEMVYKSDISLINRQAHERSIAFRFGLYFSKLISNSSFAQDYDITVDFDYNRDGVDPKIMEDFDQIHRVLPDIILHHRGFNDVNILVIEFKCVWNRNREERETDFRKLKGFTHPQRNNFQYGLGAFIDLNTTFRNTQFTYFINGEQEI